MELKISSTKPGLSSSDDASDPEKEISEGEDEDDDRNHKHRRRGTHSQSLEGDSLGHGLTRPYRKRNKTFENGYYYREGGSQSGQTWKNGNIASERDFPSRSDKRRFNQSQFSRAPLDMNQRFRGNQMLSSEMGPVRGRGREPMSWGLPDSRLGLVDFTSQMVQPGPVPPGLFAGRGLPHVANAQSTPWNAFGLVPGVLNGGLDAFHPLGMQGALRPAISPPINIGIPRQQCRDFEERGFCLRGDMCPMEHGVNRIVVDDVQSLSQFNLPGSQLLGTSSGEGALPVVSSSSGSLMKNKAFHAKYGKPGITEDGLGFNGDIVNGSMVGGPDVYDPDQPLWTNDNPETSTALMTLNQSDAHGTKSFLDMNPSDQQNIESYEEFGDDHPFRTATPSGAQSSSVWGRMGSSKNKLGHEEKNNFVGTSSSNLDRDVRSEEISLHNVPHQGKETNADKELPPKLHSDSVHNIRKPSQKALRTLFVNGIPQKDNKRDSLLSHFQKFGEVINIYMPANGERAFIQFSKREEAEAALKSPDAVMGNRFIKLWWANRDNVPDDGISRTSSVPITPRGMILNPALSHPFQPVKGKESPYPAGGKDGNADGYLAQVPVHGLSKPTVANGPKGPPVPQKKMESLENLKEELRKKREMLDQKRNEFKLQLDKLQKQGAVSKDVAVSHQDTKRLKVETPIDHMKAETSKASPKANLIPEKMGSAEHGATHTPTSNPTVYVHEPLRPSIRPPLPPGAQLVVNRFKLDNRPTSFRIASPLPDGLANVAALEEHFSTYGGLSSVEMEDSEVQDSNHTSLSSDVSARVYFTTRRSAERAFSHGKCWQGHNLQFVWLTPSKSSKEGVGSGNLPSSSNAPSDSREAANAPSDSKEAANAPSDSKEAANAPSDSKEAVNAPSDSREAANAPSDSKEAANAPSDSKEAASTDFQKIDVLGSDKPEIPTSENLGESVDERDKDSKSDSTSFACLENDEPENVTRECDAESVERDKDSKSSSTSTSSETPIS